MKGKKFLLGIVVVLLIMISVLPGCNEGQPTELVIPSSMSPYEVFNKTANAGPFIYTYPFFQGGWSAEDIDPFDMPEGASEEQFIEGFSAGIPESLYIKRDGKQAGYRDYKLVLWIIVLKYEDTESAERSFVNIGETQGLQDSTYEGIALKNGTYTLPFWWEELNVWDELNQPCYLIHSGCFVLYLFGRDDVTKDALDRIILAFGVSK